MLFCPDLFLFLLISSFGCLLYVYQWLNCTKFWEGQQSGGFIGDCIIGSEHWIFDRRETVLICLDFVLFKELRFSLGVFFHYKCIIF